VEQHTVRGNNRDGRLSGVRCRASSRGCVNVRAFAEDAGWRPQRISVPSVVHPPAKVLTAGPMLLNRRGYIGSELSMGPFHVTQPNPTHDFPGIDPTQPIEF
jgi:hypothetical protein